MPPLLALSLCTIFVLYLLKLDRRQSASVSFAAWVPTLWVLYSASRPLARWFLQGAQVESDGMETVGGVLDPLFLLTLTVLGGAIIVQRRLSVSRALWDNGWLVALYALIAISAAWSEYPGSTFQGWLRAVGALVMAMVVLSEESPRRALESILRRSAYVLLPFSLCLIKYFPEYGVAFGRWTGERMWVGVATQKNSLGRLCLVAGIYLIWVQLRRMGAGRESRERSEYYADWVVLALAIYLLLGSHSATAMMVLVVGGGALALLTWRKESPEGWHGLIALTAAGALAYGTLMPFIGADLLGGISSLLGRDATLTGRTDIWGELTRYVWEAPVLGFGFRSFWIDPPLSYALNQAHNGYLDTLLHVGMAGLLLLVAFLASVWRKAYATLREDFAWSSLTIALLLIVILHNAMETSYLLGTSHLWVILVFVAVLVSARELEEPGDEAGVV